MAYIRELAADELSEQARKQQEKLREDQGYVPNYAKAFALRPDVLAAWGQLIGAIRGHMDPRRYELVTLAAARALRSSYCMLAHGSVLLRAGLFSEAELTEIARDTRSARLTTAEESIMAFAEKVAREAHAITAADVDGLRRHGLEDAEILDVVLAATARCFFSKTVDSVGALPDSAFASLDATLRGALTTGRPIETPG